MDTGVLDFDFKISDILQNQFKDLEKTSSHWEADIFVIIGELTDESVINAKNKISALSNQAKIVRIRPKTNFFESSELSENFRKVDFDLEVDNITESMINELFKKVIEEIRSV